MAKEKYFFISALKIHCFLKSFKTFSSNIIKKDPSLCFLRPKDRFIISSTQNNLLNTDQTQQSLPMKLILKTEHLEYKCQLIKKR